MERMTLVRALASAVATATAVTVLAVIAAAAPVAGLWFAWTVIG